MDFCDVAAGLRVGWWLRAAASQSKNQPVLQHSSDASAALTLHIKALLQIFFLSWTAHPPLPHSSSPCLSPSLLPFPPLCTFCFVTAHHVLLLVLSEATLPRRCTLGNMQICFPFKPLLFLSCPFIFIRQVNMSAKQSAFKQPIL